MRALRSAVWPWVNGNKEAARQLLLQLKQAYEKLSPAQQAAAREVLLEFRSDPDTDRFWNV